VSAVPYLFIAVAALVFYETFVRLKIMRDIQRVFGVAPEAMGIIKSRVLSDLHKERAVRRLAIRVLKDTMLFAAKLIVAISISAALVYTASWFSGTDQAQLLALLISWKVLGALVLLIMLYERLRTSWRLSIVDA